MNTPQSILILGYGREGRASLPYLQSKYPDARFGVADQNAIDTISDVTMLCGDDYPTTLNEWDLVVVSPGIKPSEPLFATAQHITAATNIFFEDCRGTIIGVTGSKGKSTTASLLARILEHHARPSYLVGNIGTPALETLAQHNDENAIYVFEISSYQTRLLERGPDIAVITSLFPEHLDYHGSLEQYYADKLNLTMQQTADQQLFYGTAQSELVERAKKSPAQQHAWPSENGIHVRDGVICLSNGDQVMATADIPLLGEHNVSNAMGAIAVAVHLGLHQDVIADAVRSFEALPNRLQPVGTFRDITFYNDSISTTPESTMAALNALPDTQTIFLGGTDRGYDFTQLAQLIVKHDIKNIVLFPESGERIKQALREAGFIGNILHTRDMHEAVVFAYEKTKPGTIALLSCAAPSYWRYTNFEERGQDFEEQVLQQAE